MTCFFNFYDINYLFGVFHLNFFFLKKTFKNFVTFNLALTKISYKNFLTPSLYASSNGRMALLYISSSSSSFLPSMCLTSLTSHFHLCGLTFVHPLINVARLLYIIIEKKMNSILLFRSSYFSKPISPC